MEPGGESGQHPAPEGRAIMKNHLTVEMMRQAAERFPDAFAIAAKSLGVRNSIHLRRLIAEGRVHMSAARARFPKELLEAMEANDGS